MTFEGGEGAGKTTQIQLLANQLQKHDVDVLVTREPGGAPGAEDIRSLLVEGTLERWSAQAEALLNYAARDMHLQHTIRPALAAGRWVLCDRFMDSTRAYQGYAGGVAFEYIDLLQQMVVGATKPQLSLIFDLDPEIGLARAAQRSTGAEDRFERKGLAFHQKLRDGFLTIAEQNKTRCAVLDAAQPPEVVAQIIWKLVAARGKFDI